MPLPTNADIRETILEVAESQRPREQFGANLQSGTVLEVVRDRLAPAGPRNSELEEAILTQWHDLLRGGYFAWGMNLGNPNPPFFHFTDRGRKALERLSRDPGNPAGYLKHLSTKANLSAVAYSYLTEALSCFNNDLNKAAAVMIGAAAESVVLDLRDMLISKLNTLGHPVPKKLMDWRIKTILDELFAFLELKSAAFPRELREEFQAYWNAFAQQIRTTRNEAGHPTSVDPVTEDSVHASFLIFPEQANLASRLQEWVANDLK